MALADLFDEIADHIREKDGSTAQIVATDFPARIGSIPTGGAPQYLYGPYDVDPMVLVGALVMANIKAAVPCGENYQKIDPAKTGVLCAETYEILGYAPNPMAFIGALVLANIKAAVLCGEHCEILDYEGSAENAD